MGGLADEDFGADEAQGERAARVPDGVDDDQLTNHQFGREDGWFQAPGGKLTGGEGTGAGDLRGVDRQLPADGPSCFQKAGAGKEQGRVTGSGSDSRVVATASQSCSSSRVGQLVGPGVDFRVRCLEVTVGAQREDGAFRESAFNGFEGQPTARPAPAPHRHGST
ncbi:hypothetical protein ACIBBE_47545 [Streptomyces sp. NPDC051644]|uniref:hypothetical protein n=1 Tax=Streptomyces sp. NPDC051644 TaxID=3365666 RepID=UPI0037B2FE14